METPFFDTNRPKWVAITILVTMQFWFYCRVFNYGSLGSLIGHEISHALDTTGRKFNKNGRLTNWWLQTDVTEYEQKSKCFELQYSNYGIDGFASLGENIADSVGLKVSYRAFKSTKESDFPVVIPHLGFYTNEQLFFVSFAQLWCEIASVSEDFLDEGEHSPVKHRVIGTVSNSVDFNNAFRCISPDRNQCILW